MAPRDFSSDGAAGAFGGAGGTNPGLVSGTIPGTNNGSGNVDTTQTGGMSLADMVNDFGSNPVAWPSRRSGGGSSSGGGEVLPTGGGFGIPSNTPAPPRMLDPGLGPTVMPGSSPSPMPKLASSNPNLNWWGAGGAPGLPSAFDDGGAVPEQGGGNDLVSLALSAVNRALQYGRNKFGLGGNEGVNEKAPGGGYPDFRQSPDVEDRRGESGVKTALEGPLVNTMGAAYSLYDRGKNAMGYGEQPDPNNQMANALGAGDIRNEPAEPQGAIPDEQEEGGPL